MTNNMQHIVLNMPGKKIITRLLIIAFLLSIYGTIDAQVYKEKITKDSIRISYKWQKEKCLRKDSPIVLMLQLENLSKAKVKVSFEVLYYWKVQLQSGSKTVEYCIKPGKRIRGKRKGLAFQSPGIAQNDFRDPLFSWLIDDLRVEKNDPTHTSINIKTNTNHKNQEP